ncbi:hypothetical protein NDU88_004826 [Pleurodeles waltl]|uniref:Uncharacterized protein n=1 Tax=Pleurodeles waltl TaxID=8319 RepID=A0AAV7QD25_PLEWA|nr:hypothetical protein NDU88_004826 [Pleurodeles waltl]
MQKIEPTLTSAEEKVSQTMRLLEEAGRLDLVAQCDLERGRTQRGRSQRPGARPGSLTQKDEDQHWMRSEKELLHLSACGGRGGQRRLVPIFR